MNPTDPQKKPVKYTRRAATGAILGVALAGGLLTFGTTAAADSSGGESDSGLRPINTAGLEEALAGLPDDSSTAAMVRIGGTDCWHGSAGVRDLESRPDADPRNRVRIGSVTKVFNTAIVLQLVDEGRLRLDDAVVGLLPGVLTDDYADVTVGQLLNHTSGLPSPTFDDDDHIWDDEHRFEQWEPQEWIDLSLENEPLFEAGTQQQYTNTNTIVSGLIIEELTGSTWERQLRQRITEPLGLMKTYAPGDVVEIKGRHQHGYQVVPLDGGGTELRDLTEGNQSVTWASGDMISTVGDLETFTAALFAGEVVPESQLDNMFTVPRVPLYGGEPDEMATKSMGLERTALPDGTEVWGKTGARPGFLAGVGGTKDGERVVAYSINGTDAKSVKPNPVMMPIVLGAFGF